MVVRQSAGSLQVQILRVSNSSLNAANIISSRKIRVLLSMS